MEILIHLNTLNDREKKLFNPKEVEFYKSLNFSFIEKIFYDKDYITYKFNKNHCVLKNWSITEFISFIKKYGFLINKGKIKVINQTIILFIESRNIYDDNFYEIEL